jgi:hypothetical protein
MHTRYRTVCLLAAATVFSLGLSTATAQNAPRDQTREQAQDRVYGSQLMTPQERSEYSARMRNAKTEQEREQIRAEHHDRMQASAKERGVTLPDDPPSQAQRGRGFGGPGAAAGGGSGAGSGSGGGMGPGGGGMGPGGGGRGR